MIGYIYKLTSPNGKVYIGQTINIKRRFGEYKRHFSRPKSKIINSLNKHGWIKFNKEVIFKGNCTIDFLNSLEIYYIKKYDSVLKGLNLQHGGHNGLHSEFTKDKMRNTALSICSDKEYTKARNAHWRGRKHSEETKLKMSKKRKGRLLTEEWKSNITKFLLKRGGKMVLNTSNGVYYNSIREASFSLNIPASTLRNKINGYRVNNTDFIKV